MINDYNPYKKKAKTTHEASASVAPSPPPDDDDDDLPPLVSRMRGNPDLDMIQTIENQVKVQNLTYKSNTCINEAFFIS